MSVPASSRCSTIRLFSKEFAWAWFLDDGYLFDWLAAAVVAIINLTVPAAVIKPVDRYYNTSDATLSYPAPSGTISNALLYVLGFLFPAVVVICVAFFKRSFHDGHHALLSLLESFALASGWKRWMSLVGVYRPRWLTVLASGDASSIADARLSYPSGHAAYMFCGCALLTLYLMGKLRILSVPCKGQFLLALLCLLPVMLATFVAVTRVYDYKHAPADINAGCFIGLTAAALAYLLNFPSVLDPACPKPRARTWTTDGLWAERLPQGYPVSGSARLEMLPVAEHQ